MILRMSVLAVFGLALNTADSSGQRMQALPAHGESVSEAIGALRNLGHSRSVEAILSQEAGPWEAGSLDAMADSLVLIASHYRQSGSEAERRSAMAAVNALVLSSSVEHLSQRKAALADRGIVIAPTPYRGARHALERVVRARGDVGVRAVALTAIGEALDPAAVPFLISIATATAEPETDLSRLAIRLLAERGDSPSASALERLYRQDRVLEVNARELLRAIAADRGFRKK